MNKQKKIKILIIIVVILSVLTLSIVGYLIFDSNNDSQNNIKESIDDETKDIEEDTNDKEDIINDTESENKELSIDEFLDLLKGYWANADSTDNISISFENNLFILGYFASEASIKSPIQELEKISENEYKFLAGSDYIYVDLTEINNHIIYVRVNDYSTFKYIFISTDYNETFNYFFN